MAVFFRYAKYPREAHLLGLTFPALREASLHEETMNHSTQLGCRHKESHANENFTVVEFVLSQVCKFQTRQQEDVPRNKEVKQIHATGVFSPLFPFMFRKASTSCAEQLKQTSEENTFYPTELKAYRVTESKSK